MIRELRVRGLATVADVTLELAPGLNVLTGETGAGKSMLIDAVLLLLGGRADAGAIRPGAGRAVVEGAFDASAPAIRQQADLLGLEVEDGVLVLRREVAAEGRSRAWVNGSPVAASVLARLGAALADLHGQHDTESLLAAATQRDLLDAFAGAEQARTTVREAHVALEALRREDTDLAARHESAARKADYLRHLVAEIDGARLVPGEEEQLDLEARRLGQAGSIASQVQQALAAIEDGDGAARAALAAASRPLDALGRLDPAAGSLGELLDAALANLDELARALRAYADRLEADGGRLDAVEARRHLLASLRRKHGTTIDGVLAIRAEAGAELDLLDRAEFDRRGLAARLDAATRDLEAAAEGLSAARREGAARLARGVNRWLPRLGLPGGRFEVVLSPLREVGPGGGEEVSFAVRLNAGMEARPLARVASGGELSRLMLALKVLLAGHHGVPTLLFDEIDQGIGGEIGVQVGAALAEVAAGRQVLVITHLPQIAARAARHLVVSKRSRSGLATSDVHVALGEDRIIELARMLGDPDAETARRHAVAMLEDAGTPVRG